MRMPFLLGLTLSFSLYGLIAVMGPGAAHGAGWSVTASMAVARSNHTATLLPNGKVLVAGGIDNTTPLASAELYDPASSTWSRTADMATPRHSHTATLLTNGKVLVAGGYSNEYLTSATLYDPATNTWSSAGSMAFARASHTATLLPNGKVLVTGGYTTSGYLAST